MSWMLVYFLAAMVLFALMRLDRLRNPHRYQPGMRHSNRQGEAGTAVDSGAGWSFWPSNWGGWSDTGSGWSGGGSSCGFGGDGCGGGDGGGGGGGGE